MRRVEIERLICGGYGLGRLDGKAVFVPFSAPGDLLDIEIVARHKGYDYGKILRIIEPSGCRAVPPCPYYGSCGGCHLQHISYAEQLRSKRSILEEQLERIGGIGSPPVEEVIPSERIWGYRSRIQLHRRGVRIGFLKRGSDDVVEIEKCLIADEDANLALAGLRKNWPRGADRCEVPTGKDRIFIQINQGANRDLGRVVADLAGGSHAESALELYAGNGNLTFPLRGVINRIVAVESDPLAVREGRASVVKDKAGGIEFICRGAEGFLYDVVKESHFDLVVVDPPREGLTREVITGVAGLKPSNIIYVSCDPSILARDLKDLSGRGYRLKSVQPVDMFPHTYHIESVSLMIRC